MYGDIDLVSQRTEPAFERPVSRFEASIFVSERVLETGIMDVQTVETSAVKQQLTVPDSLLENAEASEGKAGDVTRFLGGIADRLDQMRRYRPASIIRSNCPEPSMENLAQVMIVMTTFLPQWCGHPEATRVFARLNTLVKGQYRGDARGYGSFARIIGGCWEQYRQVIPEGEREEMQNILLERSPQFILTGMQADELPPVVRDRFDIDNAVVANGFQTSIMPYGYSSLSKQVELQTHTVCDSAEGYFVSASKSAAHRVDLLFAGQPIGFYKKYNERTFVATRTVVQEGRTIMLKGGIYEFHNFRVDETQSSVDLAKHEGDIVITPLRMWEEKNAVDLMDSTAGDTPEKFEVVVERIQKKHQP